MLSISSQRIEAGGIFFDKDGTLVDLQHQFSQLMEGRLRCILPRLNGDGRSTGEKIAEAVGYDAATGRVRPDGALGRSTRAQTMAVVVRALETEGYAPGRAGAIARDAFEEADQSLPLEVLIRPTPGALTLLASLRDQGVPLACLTNDVRRRTEKVFEIMGIRECFDLILGADDAENPKPDPSLFLKACGALHLAPREVVMVGDSEDDMEMARGAGAGWAVRIMSEDSARLSCGGSDLHIGGLEEIRVLQAEERIGRAGT